MPLTARRIMKIPPRTLYALYFDGIDDYVYLSGNMFNFNQYDEFTIIVWAMRTAPGQGAVAGLHPGSIYRQPGMWFWPSENDFHFGFGDGSRWISTAVSNVLGISRWFMLGIRWSYSRDRLEGLVNGNFVGYVSTEGSKPYPNTVYNIGRSDTYHRGYISQALIYTRWLTDNEFQQIYNNPDDPVRDGLVLWLHWNSIDPATGKWYDKSGNGNHGTIYGATLVQIVKSPKRVLTPARVIAPVR